MEKKVSAPDRLLLEYIANVMERKLENGKTEERILEFLKQAKVYQEKEELG